MDNVETKNDNLLASSPQHLFTQLRKVATHPLLLRTRYKSKNEIKHLTTTFYKYGAFKGETCTKDMVQREMEKYNDFQIDFIALDLNFLVSGDVQYFNTDEPENYITSVSWLPIPSAKIIAIGVSDSSIWLFDVEKQKEVRKFFRSR